jgi:hypothetical protein
VVRDVAVDVFQLHGNRCLCRRVQRLEQDRIDPDIRCLRRPSVPVVAKTARKIVGLTEIATFLVSPANAEAIDGRLSGAAGSAWRLPASRSTRPSGFHVIPNPHINVRGELSHWYAAIFCGGRS